MPKLKHRLPSYCRHKASGQAVVTLSGKDHYLGEYGSPESQEKFQRLIAEWLSGPSAAPTQSSDVPSEEVADLRINEMLIAYFKHAEGYYTKNGKPTAEVTNLQHAARPLAELYGSKRACEFGPRSLKAVRQAMIRSGLCRNVINHRVNRIRRIFKWAVEGELIEPSVLHGLQAVAPLKHGRSDARESEPVTPVADSLVDAIQPHTARQVWAMVELQRITGMRSSEVTSMRACDIDTSGRVWLYQPDDHKTKHHGHDRQIFLGPNAQRIIRPFLRRDLMAYLFSPREAQEERRARQHAKRKTPLSCGNKPGTNRRSKPRKQPGERYTTQSYLRAIYYACDKAFPHPELSKIKPKDLTDEQRDELKQWRSDHRWHPHQLRHNAATHLRKEYGIEAARIILGHKSAAITEVYAELDAAKAADIMAKIG